MDVIYAILTFTDNVLVQALLAAPLLFSLVVSYRYLQVPDVTIDGSSLLSASVCVLLMQNVQVPLPVALFVATLAGFLSGVLSGILVEVFKIDGLLAGILNAFLLYSVGLTLIGASKDFEAGTTIFSWLRGLDLDLSVLLDERLIVHPHVLLFLLLLAFSLKGALDWFLRREWGVVLRGTSSNILFLQIRGINTKRVRVLAFGLANAFVGFGATLISMYDGSVQILKWPGTIIFALSVGILGWEAARQIRRLTGFIMRDTTAIILGAVVYFSVVRLCYYFSIPTSLPRFLIATYIVAVLAEKRGAWRRIRELFS